MKIAGIILIAIALVDFIGSYTGFDLWGTLGIPLPELVWTYSAYIVGLAGYALFKLGSGSEDSESTPEAD
jgi:hypothetical protein